MGSESLHIFDPRRNLQLQGFAGRAATTTLHDATETGVSISGIFQAAEDFAVLGFPGNVEWGCAISNMAITGNGSLRVGDRSDRIEEADARCNYTISRGRILEESSTKVAYGFEH